MYRMSFNELREAMYNFNKENNITSKGMSDKQLKGVVVFTADSFDKPFTEVERSYEITNSNKAFLPNMCSNSIFANCLDGVDLGVRLDLYLTEWKVDYCYLKCSE